MFFLQCVHTSGAHHAPSCMVHTGKPMSRMRILMHGWIQDNAISILKWWQRKLPIMLSCRSAMPVVDGRRGFGAADQAIEVFENLVGDAVRAVCGEEVCEQWRSLRETK